MISISNNMIALNDEFAINDDDLTFYERFLNLRSDFSWIVNFFKTHLNFFKYLYNLYGYLVSAISVIYYSVCACLIGLVIFYGYRIIASLINFFWQDILSYFSNKKITTKLTNSYALIRL